MASEYTVELGKRIRAARIKTGLTQSELAERADVSTNHISAIERGVYDTRVEMLYRIATVLGVSGDYLLMGAALQPFVWQSAWTIPRRWHDISCMG